MPSSSRRRENNNTVCVHLASIIGTENGLLSEEVYFTNYAEITVSVLLASKQYCASVVFYAAFDMSHDKVA